MDFARFKRAASFGSIPVDEQKKNYCKQFKIGNYLVKSGFYFLQLLNSWPVNEILNFSKIKESGIRYDPKSTKNLVNVIWAARLFLSPLAIDKKLNP